MEMLVLVCVCSISTLTDDLELPRSHQSAKDRTDKGRLIIRRFFYFILYFGNIQLFFFFFSQSHFHSVVGDQSAVCSIGRFYDVVLGFCTVPTAESFLRSD